MVCFNGIALSEYYTTVMAKGATGIEQRYVTNVTVYQHITNYACNRKAMIWEGLEVYGI